MRLPPTLPEILSPPVTRLRALPRHPSPRSVAAGVCAMPDKALDEEKVPHAVQLQEAKKIDESTKKGKKMGDSVGDLITTIKGLEAEDKMIANSDHSKWAAKGGGCSVM